MKFLVSALLAIGMLTGFSPAQAQTFNGYGCTIDCSGHEAGYDWAQKKNLNSIYDCSGNSNSFVEGCRSFFEEQEDDGYGSSLYDDDSESDPYGLDEVDDDAGIW